MCLLKLLELMGDERIQLEKNMQICSCSYRGCIVRCKGKNAASFGIIMVVLVERLHSQV